jgi:hypothetical protein
MVRTSQTPFEARLQIRVNGVEHMVGAFPE